ncbi:DUF2281 domain-containing protein, partial [Candidatus Saccharibacteria bacterium]|nr:DUF2281 domain-containing protein [Candidatus Saccharibacteria bacterium]NIV72428.1 DUF2281 domain-containing protein [Calditrichia bacterium]NIW79810.1 DUF2281 domain-containing protein [Calditrichia bacterium]
MSSKEVLLREIEETPDELLEEVIDFVRFLKQRKGHEKFEITAASESSLRKDWLLPEGDEAWQHL